jgi:signal transduction histidine kinase
VADYAPEYAADRPWPGLSGWSDAHSRRALQDVADNCAALAGFRYSVINVLHRGEFRAVAACGDDEMKRTLIDSTTTVEEMRHEETRSVPWGTRFRWSDGTTRTGPGFGVVLDRTKADGDDAWDPDDFLFAWLHDASGAVAGFLCLDVPVDQRRTPAVRWPDLDRCAAQAERALVIALEREQALGRLRDLELGHASDVVATVSHELRTPLAAIVGHAELLASSPALGPEERRSVEAIERASVRLRRTVDDLLVLFRIDRTGDVTGPTGVLDLREVVADAVDLLEPLAEAADVGLRAVAPLQPVWAGGDLRDLDRAVINLVTNAIKYSDPGGHVVVTVDRSDDAVWVEVVDDGIGIAADDLAGLFAEFNRTSNPQALVRPGSGLGLAIAHRIVERAGGRIDVRSELGEGSTFRIELRAGRMK